MKPATAITSPAPIFKEPLVRHLFTADPSAHVFEGRIYIYGSHDLDEGLPPTDTGDHFDMRDYHVLSLADMSSPVVDHGRALDVADVPWAARQMWAPDAAYKDGTYFLYFPAKDHAGVFRIGVATSTSPTGPFEAQPTAIEGSYSIDPAVFIDDDGQAYMYFGGLWGGQLERYQGGSYNADAVEPTSGSAVLPRVAKLRPDMLGFEAAPSELLIVDEHGAPLSALDKDRRYFEGPWLHKHAGLYYFSYSTGDTHFLVYATSPSPLGPFTYRGKLMTPPIGWTTHHSTVRAHDQWYLFYHDSSLSGGDTSRRCVKVQPFAHEPDGSILTLTP